MKRQLEESHKLTLSSLNTDCLSRIFEKNEWKGLGALAITSKEFLLIMTSTEIIHSIIQFIQAFPTGEKPLPPWTHFSLPLSYLPTPSSLADPLQKTLENCRLQILKCPIQAQNRNLAGGFLVKEMSGGRWQSDLDLFRQTEWDQFEPRRFTSGEWDIIEDNHHEKIEWVTDDFDLSLCQLGYSSNRASQEQLELIQKK